MLKFVLKFKGFFYFFESLRKNLPEVMMHFYNYFLQLKKCILVDFDSFSNRQNLIEAIIVTGLYSWGCHIRPKAHGLRALKTLQKNALPTHNKPTKQ